MSDTENIIRLSDAELEVLKLLGPDAVQQVIDFIEVIKRVPQQFEWLTVFQLQCLSAHLKFHPTVPASLVQPRSNGTTHLSDSSGATAAEPDLVSLFESVHFYTGICEDHPLLLHRSDLLQRPFVIPRERFSVIPEKTVHSANHPILKNKLWKEAVAPEIIELLKDPSRGVCVSTMLPVRFSTHDDNDMAVVDDYIVLRISVHPDTTKETSCRNTNTDILAILAEHGIEDVAVHWIKGAVESLGGPPPMMRVVRDTDPTHYIRRALTVVLGVPLAAEALANSDAQGSLGLYFYEGKDRCGNKSNRVMCLTNKHATSSDTTQDYDYSGRSPQQFMRNCSSRRFQQVVNETRALIATKLGDAKLFAEQLAELMAKPKSEDEETAAEDEEDKERKQQDLKRVEKDVIKLSDFLKLLSSTWSDAYQRIVGHLDWAPKIASDIDSRRYTRDLGVIALDDNKFKESFQGNCVYLAGKYTHDEINSFFHPNVANSPSFKYPSDHLFRLSGCVDAAGWPPHRRQGWAVDRPHLWSLLGVGYTCDKFGRDSWEVAVFNFSTKHGSFSAKGDSGASIFNAEGKLVAILHSGMPRGVSNYITFGTPGHFVLELVKEHYPYADFDSLKFDA